MNGRLPALSERPLVSIRATAASPTLGLAEVWAYRELLYFLVWRDLKVRYKDTVLGAGWAIVQPLFAAAVFSIFFGTFAAMPSDGIPYPIFAYAGVLLWTFFANAVVSAAGSLIASSGLVTKVYFPRMIVPLAAVVSALVDFAVGAVLLVAVIAYYGAPSPAMLPVLLAPPALVAVLAAAVGTAAAACIVRFRDLRYVVPFVVQLWMFASPVIYPMSLLPERPRWLWQLNPLTGIIEGFRAALFGRPVDWPALGWAMAISLATAGAAVYIFGRLERTFADVM